MAILAYTSFNQSRNYRLLGVVLFLVGGLAIKPDRENSLLGVRRENIFHFLLGTAFYLISIGG